MVCDSSEKQVFGFCKKKKEAQLDPVTLKTREQRISLQAWIAFQTFYLASVWRKLSQNTLKS